MLECNVNLEGKIVLVTGAAGFIGSNLVKRLFRDVNNIKVIGIDSITDYYDVNIKYARLKEIETLGKNWSFVHASIADKDIVCYKLVKRTKIKGIYKSSFQRFEYVIRQLYTNNLDIRFADKVIKNRCSCRNDGCLCSLQT